MTEEERAEYYEQHKDDPQVWGEIDEAFQVPTHAKKQGGLSVTLTVRFVPEDAAKLRLLAERLNLSYSDVVREAVRQVVQPRFSIDLRDTNVAYKVPSRSTQGEESPIQNPLTAAETRTTSSVVKREPTTT